MTHIDTSYVEYSSILGSGRVICTSICFRVQVLNRVRILDIRLPIPYALFSKRCNIKECDWVSMTSLDLLVWNHYVRQQPPTVVPAKAKADIANAHSIPVFVVSYSHPIFWTMIRGYIFLKYYMLKKKYRMIINHSWILTPWINIVGLKKVGLKYKSHGFNMYYGTHTVYHL